MDTNWFIIFFTVIFMELFAWASHKYLMHGFMWRWHQSHHIKHSNLLEKNDLFGLLFALFSCICIVIGSTSIKYGLLFPIGIGIAVYGLFYFLFHDIIVHKRINHKLIFKNQYLKRIIKAHHIHHKTQSKKGAEAFGFLYAHKKYSSKNIQ
jgi:beta-carotene 3-hydroxylase